MDAASFRVARGEASGTGAGDHSTAGHQSRPITANQSWPITANRGAASPCVISPVISHRASPTGRGLSSHGSYLVGCLGGF